MNSVMENALIIVVNLLGQLEGCVSHKDTQLYQNPLTKKNVSILHTDRKQNRCYKRINISKTVLNSWTKDCPFWEKPKHWEKLSKQQRINSHVAKFDEGYGVTYEII